MVLHCLIPSHTMVPPRISFVDQPSFYLFQVIVSMVLVDMCLMFLNRHVFREPTFILSAVATNVFGDSPVSNYSIMVIEGKTCTDSFLPCEKFPSIWIRTLGSLLLLMLILFIVSFVVTVFTIKSKQRLQREIQQSHACRDSDMTGTKVIYEEVELKSTASTPNSNSHRRKHCLCQYFWQ